MSDISISIPKNPKVPIAQDFYRLRGEGIAYIEKLCGSLWTDYNSHDPGITILEALCYTLTDLAYRTNFEIQDLLAIQTESKKSSSSQTFFSARDILTNHPLTEDDYRRLLIDLDGVRNAWLFCNPCECDQNSYFSWCDKNQQLTLSFKTPADATLPYSKVAPQGLLEVFLELDADSVLGDLNNRKIERNYSYPMKAGLSLQQLALELRFPDLSVIDPVGFNGFLNKKIKAISVRLGAVKGFDLFTDASLNSSDVTNKNGLRNGYLRQYWNNVFYADFTVTFTDLSKFIIPNVAVRFFGGSTIRNDITIDIVKNYFIDMTSNGLLSAYRDKSKETLAVLHAAKLLLQQHRNLDEDFATIKLVNVEDVAVCADIVVKPNADIEKIQAEIWFAIENYISPYVPFYSLQEMQLANVPVENIFEGPQLNHGFIQQQDLIKSQLKTQLRVSDLVNALMDIEGVLAVNNMVLSKYDDSSNIVTNADGKTSEPWQLDITSQCQPRFYRTMSRFMFFKNNLPFTARKDEAYDTYIQLRGELERPKFAQGALDLPLQAGAAQDLTSYFPVQYSLPMTYGVGTEGLPSRADPLRRAQAKQLKAYLMVFEQLLGNAFSQIAHVADLFSIDPEVKRTYFVREFSQAIIQGYDDVTQSIHADLLESLTESPSEFEDRRNRFLNHLLARFGEQFNEYTLLLTNVVGKKVALDKLINDKISFLNVYPEISRNRAKAFSNYSAEDISHALLGENNSIIKKRVSLLLGYPDLFLKWEITHVLVTEYRAEYELADMHGKLWFTGKYKVVASNATLAKNQAYQLLMQTIVQADAYHIKKKLGLYLLSLVDAKGITIGHAGINFSSAADALNYAKEILGWGSNNRSLVIEHLLLRPKFVGDALYPACNDGSCNTCGDDDPYSFKLTYIMPGWTEPFSVNLAMRNFADNTVRQELPAHLLGKICWVANDGFVSDPCNALIEDFSELLVNNLGLKDDLACQKSGEIYTALNNDFILWFDSIKLKYLHSLALNGQLSSRFTIVINTFSSLVIDPNLRKTFLEKAVLYFHDIAFYGWQFERFESAWNLWLQANAKIDWIAENVNEKVLAILVDHCIQKSLSPNQLTILCDCAKTVISNYGTDFYIWFEQQIVNGSAYEDIHFSSFHPSAIKLCDGIAMDGGMAAAVKSVLDSTYQSYIEVSYRLRVVVNLLSKLRNTYPGATLHDCDDGSDINPVRLGSTTLGSQPLKTTLTISSLMDS